MTAKLLSFHEHPGARDHEERPHLFCFLTREEWKLCYAAAFIEHQGQSDYGGALGLDRYATPGLEGRTDDWSEEFRRAIRWLAMEHGFEFQTLRVGENGSITGRPTEPDGWSDDVPRAPLWGNALFVFMLAQGQLPNPLDAIRHAISWCVRYPTLPLDTFRAVEADIMESLADVSPIDPEIQATLERLDQEALNVLGVLRGPRGSGEVN